jgi:hypothetical protein
VHSRAKYPSFFLDSFVFHSLYATMVDKRVSPLSQAFTSFGVVSAASEKNGELSAY